MTDILFKSTPEVRLLSSMGGDLSILHAARVSVDGDEGIDIPEELLEEHELERLIRYLMSHRHGTPFEHNAMKFYAHCPIFVFREWHRHRIAWSYNEESGRYKQLDPVFHIPAEDRPLVNVGTSARPKMVPGSPEQYERQVARMKRAYEHAYVEYLDGLDDGVAKEVAREVLPVGIFSSMYATTNLRSALAFLSLRVHDPDATFVSHPQYEIQQAARQIEDSVKTLFPIAHAAFVENGRVAP